MSPSFPVPFAPHALNAKTTPRATDSECFFAILKTIILSDRYATLQYSVRLFYSLPQPTDCQSSSRWLKYLNLRNICSLKQIFCYLLRVYKAESIHSIETSS